MRKKLTRVFHLILLLSLISLPLCAFAAEGDTGYLCLENENCTVLILEEIDTKLHVEVLTCSGADANDSIVGNFILIDEAELMATACQD